MEEGKKKNMSERIQKVKKSKSPEGRIGELKEGRCVSRVKDAWKRRNKGKVKKVARECKGHGRRRVMVGMESGQGTGLENQTRRLEKAKTNSNKRSK